MVGSGSPSGLIKLPPLLAAARSGPPNLVYGLSGRTEASHDRGRVAAACGTLGKGLPDTGQVGLG